LLSACDENNKTSNQNSTTKNSDSSVASVQNTSGVSDTVVVPNEQPQQASENLTQANKDNSNNTNNSASTSVISSKEQAASTTTTSSAQNNSQSSTNLQQKIAEENARHENVINKLNQKKQDILSLRDAQFNALGASYSGTEEEYLAKQSELRNRSNKLQFFISSCRGSNLSQSTQKKLKEAQKEKEAVDTELSALEKAMSVKRLKQDIENQTKTQIDNVEKEIQAENDLYARNLASLK
jgi:hypothetical protein